MFVLRGREGDPQALCGYRISLWRTAQPLILRHRSVTQLQCSMPSTPAAIACSTAGVPERAAQSRHCFEDRGHRMITG
jgi:hypothetical protein